MDQSARGIFFSIFVLYPPSWSWTCVERSIILSKPWLLRQLSISFLFYVWSCPLCSGYVFLFGARFPPIHCVLDSFFLFFFWVIHGGRDSVSLFNPLQLIKITQRCLLLKFLLGILRSRNARFAEARCSRVWFRDELNHSQRAPMSGSGGTHLLTVQFNLVSDSHHSAINPLKKRDPSYRNGLVSTSTWFSL